MKALAKDQFDFTYLGKATSYELFELEDGYWKVICNEPDFFDAVGSYTVNRTNSLAFVLERVNNINECLADAMRLPFYKRFDEALKKHKTNFSR